MIMERKVGEIFEYNGEWYQCVKSPDGSCKHCDMNFGGKCPIPIKECVASARSDLFYVIFKKLEKVGEPIIERDRTFQCLKALTTECVGCVFLDSKKSCDKDHYIDGPCPDREIWVEIKQTKEDMEEKKLNLKPFDIQKAREGKPVCTRDGAKARIICFDAKSDAPIIALITTDDGTEIAFDYLSDGTFFNSENPDNDLMMLPEKRSGWINVKKDAGLFKSREEAERNCTEGYTPVRVEFKL